MTEGMRFFQVSVSRYIWGHLRKGPCYLDDKAVCRMNAAPDADRGCLIIWLDELEAEFRG